MAAVTPHRSTRQRGAEAYERAHAAPCPNSSKLEPSARLTQARETLEASYALPEPLTRDEMAADRARLRATVEQMIGYCEGLVAIVSEATQGASS